MASKKNFFSHLSICTKGHQLLKEAGSSLSSKTFMGHMLLLLWLLNHLLLCVCMCVCLITYFKSFSFITCGTQLTTVHVKGIQIGKREMYPSECSSSTIWHASKNKLVTREDSRLPHCYNYDQLKWLSHNFQQVSVPVLGTPAFIAPASWLVKFIGLGTKPRALCMLSPLSSK